jgi:hexosaminidase
MADAPAFRLDSDYAPTGGEPGTITLTLRNLGRDPVSGFRLAFNALFRVKSAHDLRGGRVLEQVSNYLVVAPPDGSVLEPGGEWSISADRLSHVLTHYNYGPKAAYLILADGSLAPVSISLMTQSGERGAPLLEPRPRPHLPAGQSPLALVPFPAAASVAGRRAVGAPLAFAAGPPEARAAFDAASALAERLFAGEPPLFGRDGIASVARIEPMEEGGYRIAFAESLTVAAADRAGFLHAFVTLGQMLRGARTAPDEFIFPAEGTIADRPRFGFRGAHLDVARQMYGMGAIRRLVDCLGWLKLNRFHLHLTDDEGWRFDVPGYPQLAEIAAWRGHGLAVPPLLGSGAERYGGGYPRADLAGLVAHAAELGVIVIPEVDIPGHCFCVLQALPGLRDPAETGIYRSIQYFPNDALNPAVPQVYDFLESVFAELAGIFPSPWLHIGGDEVADDAWLGSPLALALMKERGWTGVHQLQSLILKRAQEIVRALGRGVGAWEEAAYGDGIDAAGSYLVAWRKSASGLMLAGQGYDVVMAPAEHYYLDIAQSTEWWEPGASWAGTVPVAAAYDYEPGSDWPDEAKPRMIGVQACLWSENMHERRLVDHMIFPRMPAMAEAAWTPSPRKDFRRFSAIEPLIFRAGEKVGA